MTQNTSTRGRTFTGIVTSDKMSKTVTITWTRRHYIPKYERYEKRRTKIKAHNPDEIDARVGDHVVVMETRPLSKTKNFIVIKKLGAAEEASKPKPQEVKKEKKPVAEEEKPAKKPTVKKTVKKTSKKPAAEENKSE